MPYKIVLTKEKGKTVLTSIPDSWENGGILSWPTKNANEKLKCQAKPENDWDILRCVLKRRDILTFEEAEAEINRMCEYSDTDTMDTADEMPVKRMLKKRKIVQHNKPDFNDEAQTCMKDLQNNLSTTSSAIATALPLDISHEVLNEIQLNEVFLQTNSFDSSQRNWSDIRPDIQPDIQQDIQPDIQPDTHPDIQLHIHPDIQPHNIQLDNQPEQNPTIIASDDILVILQSVMENQRVLNENQENMTSELVKLNVRFEEFIKGFLSTERSSTKVEKFNFVAIAKADDLEELENNLRDKDYRAKLDKTFSVLCKSNGKGLNAAYKLVDHIFERDFMKQCSWAGGSRGGGKKICFKSFKQTIDWFFNTVKSTDNSFRLEECEDFFKNILRNSKKRSQLTDMRQSASKKRPKKAKKTTMNNKHNEPGKNDENAACESMDTDSEEKENVGLETSV